MKSGFLDKLIARIGRLEPEEVQNALVRLVQEKGFLEKIFESLKEGVIVIDVDGQVNYVNRAACGFFGFDQDEAVDNALDNLIRGFDWATLISAGQVVSRDIEVFYPEHRFLHFYLSPIEDNALKETLGYVMIVHDITMTRKLTQEMIDSERLSALTLLAAGVAHDIRYAPLEFDGWAQLHWTLRFSGERYSLVWFTPRGCECCEEGSTDR